MQREGEGLQLPSLLPVPAVPGLSPDCPRCPATPGSGQKSSADNGLQLSADACPRCPRLLCTAHAARPLPDLRRVRQAVHHNPLRRPVEQAGRAVRITPTASPAGRTQPRRASRWCWPDLVRTPLARVKAERARELIASGAEPSDKRKADKAARAAKGRGPGTGGQRHLDAAGEDLTP
jgi:hypothetical protein